MKEHFKGTEDKRFKKPFKKDFKKSSDTEKDQKDNRSFKRSGDKKFGKPFNKDLKKSSYTEKDHKDKDSSFRTEDKKFRKPFKKNFKKPSGVKKENNDDNLLIRLNRYIANAGICSRREADKLIATGVVSVNGKIVTELGTKVSREDAVQFGGETLHREKMIYVLLNKPKDYITTTDDPEGRKTVMALVRNAGKERIYPVGRLDRSTTGLLLLTNDGEMAKKLMHPRYGVKKIYHVELDRNLQHLDMQKIINGIELEDGITQVDEISLDGDGTDKKCIGLELHSGKNRIVRRIFESLGYKVVKLDRVYYAGLTKKDLPRGKWRFLTQMEINMLKMKS